MSTTRVAKQGRASRSLRGRIVRYGPLLLWMAFISFASTGEFSADNTSLFVRPLVLWLFPETSAETLVLIHVCVRKTAHFVEYGLLGFLGARAFVSSSAERLRTHWFGWSLLLVCSYAFLDEYHQSFVPNRTGSIIDILIDIVGGLAALLIYLRCCRRGVRQERCAS